MRLAIILALLIRFPNDSVWNHQVSGLPVHPMSRYWIGAFFPTSRGFAINPDPSCGLPVNKTGPGWQRMTFTYQAESDTCPFPFSSTQPFESCNPDSHWAAVDTTTDTLFELYARSGGTASGAGAGATWSLKSNLLRPNGWTSATESGLPLSTGLLNFDEAHSGMIRHALIFALWSDAVADSCVWPARHFARRPHQPNAIPLGIRMRLKADYPIPQDAPIEIRAILTSMRDYGLFLGDRAGGGVGEFSLEAIPDPRWDGLLGDLAARTYGISRYLEFVDESKFQAEPNSGRWKSRNWWWPF